MAKVKDLFDELADFDLRCWCFTHPYLNLPFNCSRYIPHFRMGYPIAGFLQVCQLH